ncbi:hypothetical protein [Pleionea litopenaei]|uniref:Uncharacterized protein n=1 Tax=Pleionea litopenaei TaxID=3070815 RepID=A0AA51RTT7_9GAMM|nr:hypothetical protein [Pleionea sp. HL-JVS1]WMS87492.1 hypothetical protein Q9312_00845 [Pleionea sp. HL-JVS1]
MTSEPFALYSTTWWAYIGCGVVFLLLVWWKVRHWNYYFQTGLLSLIAAGAFAYTQVPEAETMAPATIAFILELENEGSEGEIAMLTHLAVVWLILYSLLIGVRFGWQKWRAQQSKDHASREEPEIS